MLSIENTEKYIAIKNCKVGLHEKSGMLQAKNKKKKNV